MSARLQKITIKLKETVACWLRAEAARQHLSVSSLVANILRSRVAEDSDYSRAMRRALARKPFLKTNGKYL